MEEIRNNVILDLKRRAKQSKEQNDTEQALEWLKQAKIFGGIDGNNGGVLLSQQLKKLAVFYKQNNDIEAAKDSLIKSKQVDHLLLQQQQTDASSKNPNEDDEGDAAAAVDMEDDEDMLELNDDDAGEANIEFTDEEMIDKEMIVEFQLCSMPIPSQELYDARVLHHKKLALAYKQKNDIPKATSSLRFAKQLQAVQMALKSNSGGGIGGMDGDDVDEWMKSLTAEESDLLGELLNDNNNSNSADDNEMMDMMINGTDSENGQQQQQSSSSNNTDMKFDLKDIETMDDDDLIECLKMGMVLPSVDEIQDQATSKQKEAISYKKSGDLDSAKSKLSESKQIKLQAERLDRIYNSYHNNNNDPTTRNGEVHDDDLEALLSSSSSKRKQPQNETSTPPAQPQNPWLSKPSEEIKAEVIKLKNEKKVAEATKLLQIYKEVLKSENEAKEKAKCQQLITSLEEQIGFAQQQLKLFCFYERFDTTDCNIGSDQLRLWNLYIQGCQQVIERITKYGSNSIQISKATTNKLKVVNEMIDIAGLVERITSNGGVDGNLEVSIIEVRDIHDNRPYQRFLSKLSKNNKNKENNEKRDEFASSRPIMEVDAKLQLPLNEDSPHVHMLFHPTAESTPPTDKQETSAAAAAGATEEGTSSATTATNHQFHFDESHIVTIPRGDTRQAKTILKRMETKKVQINISVKPPPPPPEKKSWFFSSPSKKQDEERAAGEIGSTNLGKVILDLNDLLLRNCIAGDFPITVNSKEVGGTVRLCIRTDKPFDINQFEGYVSSSRCDDDDNDVDNNASNNADHDEEKDHELLVPYSNCLSFSEATSTTTN